MFLGLKDLGALDGMLQRGRINFTTGFLAKPTLDRTVFGHL